MGDRELKTKVAHILGQEPLFADHTIIVISDGHLEIIHDDKTNASRIMASIKDGIVTLSGKVNSINHRRFAEVLMWWIPGCRRVNNSLEVVPPQSDDDDTLTDAIRLVLEKDPLVHAAQLRVDTRAHIAELKGYLSSEEEHVFALRDTWTVPGVEDVRDNIQVGSLSA